MIVTVRAEIEFDVEELVNEVVKEGYGDTVADITMDDIFDYVSNNLTYLDHNRKSGKWTIEGYGRPIVGFDDRSYDEIEEKLESMKGE